MSYVLINYSCDGTHNRVFKTPEKAKNALALFLGRKVEEISLDRSYYGDFGNRLIIEEREASHTARSETALRDAYDARECGVATKKQLTMLNKKGY